MLSNFFFFFKQKTAYEMRISDWSSDVCSSDLTTLSRDQYASRGRGWSSVSSHSCAASLVRLDATTPSGIDTGDTTAAGVTGACRAASAPVWMASDMVYLGWVEISGVYAWRARASVAASRRASSCRSEEHTSELQSLM